MKIAMIGSGYVGLVSGALFADRGNEVICVDHNPEVVDLLNSGKIHIFEPGLEEIVRTNRATGRISFTTNISEAVANSDVIFLAVGTPSDEDGSFNLTYIKQAARDVGLALRNAKGFKVIVGKSTVPQGTFKILSEIIHNELQDSNPYLEWAYVSNPETLAEGTAVRDFSSPDRIIIGTNSDRAFEVMEELYHPFVRKDRKMLRGSPSDAELAKLGANTMLALRVAAINELAKIADHTPGADMEKIRQMIGSDSRIGHTFLFPGPGYGGSCFPKDVQGLVHQAKLDGFIPSVLDQIHRSNESQKQYMGEKIMKLLSQKERPKIAIWGLTFKPGTDDMRDAASIPIITHLINQGVEVSVYDPQDKKAREIFGDRIKFCATQLEAVEQADALISLTEWPQFDSPNYAQLKVLMKGNQIFDLRNRWIPHVANKHGFDYFGIGRNYPLWKPGN